MEKLFTSKSKKQWNVNNNKDEVEILLKQIQLEREEQQERTLRLEQQLEESQRLNDEFVVKLGEEFERAESMEYEAERMERDLAAANSNYQYLSVQYQELKKEMESMGRVQRKSSVYGKPISQPEFQREQVSNV